MGGRISAMVRRLAVFVGDGVNAVKPLGITSPKRLPNYPRSAAVAETVRL